MFIIYYAAGAAKLRAEIGWLFLLVKKLKKKKRSTFAFLAGE